MTAGYFIKKHFYFSLKLNSCRIFPIVFQRFENYYPTYNIPASTCIGDNLIFAIQYYKGYYITHAVDKDNRINRPVIWLRTVYCFIICNRKTNGAKNNNIFLQTQKGIMYNIIVDLSKCRK